MLYIDSIQVNKRTLKLTWDLILLQIPTISWWKDITHRGTIYLFYLPVFIPQTWINTGMGEWVWGQKHSWQFDFTPRLVVWNLLVWGIQEYNDLYVFHLNLCCFERLNFSTSIPLRVGIIWIYEVNIERRQENVDWPNWIESWQWRIFYRRGYFSADSSLKMYQALRYEGGAHAQNAKNV